MAQADRWSEEMWAMSSINITSAETLLRMADATESAYTGAILAREALRIALKSQAERGPSVAMLASKLALARAKAISPTAPKFEREVGRDVALEAERFLDGRC